VERKIFLNARIVDAITQTIFNGWFSVKNGRFEFVEEGEVNVNEPVEIVDLKGLYCVPGLIDAHMHVESSLVTCSEFAKAALRHGTVAVLQDPHEMANVFGKDGVRFMFEEGSLQPLKFYGAIPSCVPPTRFNLETANASIDQEDVEELVKIKNVLAIGEVMDYPALVQNNEEILKIIEAGLRHNLLIEGHCPTLSNEELSKYIFNGVGSDHTLTDPKKMLEQLRKGMFVMIQEKSIKPENIELIKKLPDRSRILLVTDDVPPSRLIEGHLNLLITKAIESGWPTLDAIASATIRPASYLRLKDLGAIAPGKKACFFVCEDLSQPKPLKVFVDGIETDRLDFPKLTFSFPPSIFVQSFDEKDFKLTNVPDGVRKVRVVVANPQNSFTELAEETIVVKDGFAEGDFVNVAVFHRKSSKPRGHVGLLKGFGLHRGAFASSFAHDTHNILVVGRCAEHMKVAANELLNMNGGIVFYDGSILLKLPLEIGGIISERSLIEIAPALRQIEERLKFNGAKHAKPFLFLSTLSLTLSPKFKFSDLGIVDVESAKLLCNLTV